VIHGWRRTAVAAANAYVRFFGDRFIQKEPHMEISENTLEKPAAGTSGASNSFTNIGNPAAGVDRAAAMAHDAVNTAASAVAPTAEWLQQQGESFVAMERKLMDDTCKYIAANPLQSVAIAVAAGFLLSRLMRR
jgi:ElaB/YqjD/DUF883 family membrane-anchored ribosome-binding protein